MISDQEEEEVACVPKAEATSVAVCALDLPEELAWELVEVHPEQVVEEDRDQHEDEVEVEGGEENVRNLRKKV